jgi:hypothetical protein
MDVPEPLQVAVAVPAVPIVRSVPVPNPVPPEPEKKPDIGPAVSSAVTAPVKAAAAPKTVSPPPPVNALPAPANDVPVVVAATPPPPPPAPVEETPAASEPLPEPPNDDVVLGRTVAPVGAPSRQKELAESANSVRLLVTSAATPAPITVLVTMDNEVLFRHDVRGSMSEEVALPPGQHRLRVNLLVAARRVGRPQEVTARFFPGQRRVLNIEFLPDAPRRANNAGEGNRFTISLK